MTDQTIVSVFQQDHREIDRALEQYRNRQHNDVQAAKDSFERVLTGLQRHIAWEEQLLFPSWERKSGMTGGGPTQVMRLEHRRIADLLNAIRGKMQVGNIDTEQEEHQLVELLASHNMKEERILYPAIDQIVSPEERAGIFQAMKDPQPGSV
ncbi:MAG: hemerythrin domain-containing protein [Nitrospiraceae bacterium]